MLTKEDISNAIRKTAKENGNIPLGLQRFESKTGISKYEWMRYWPRFSEAQIEAGYKPNTLQGPHKEEYIFEKFISLCRELGKIPVRGDLYVKRNKDPKFPAASVFERHGRKQIFLSKLLKYSVGKKYKDIIELCNKAIREQNQLELESNISESNVTGSVYLAKSGRYYKIGRTNSMGRRHHEITILLPEGFTLIHEVKTDDPSGIETYWHNRFESKHKNGEWYDLDSSDVRAFKKWKKIA